MDCLDGRRYLLRPPSFPIISEKSKQVIPNSTARISRALRHSGRCAFSPKMIDIARRNYPELTFISSDAEDPETVTNLGEPFDIIVLSDTIGSLSDCQQALENLLLVCTPDTRIAVACYSKIWEPLLDTAELFGLKMPQPEQNWLSTDDIKNLLSLSNFEFITREWRQLLPRRLFGIGTFVNRFIAPLPGIRRLCLRNYVVARVSPCHMPPPRTNSATVLVPCKNEKGNIENAVIRIPDFCDNIEILFVEGGSTDGTHEEIQRVIKAYPEKNIRALTQDGKGKGEAVRIYCVTGVQYRAGVAAEARLKFRSPSSLVKFFPQVSNPVRSPPLGRTIRHGVFRDWPVG